MNPTFSPKRVFAGMQWCKKQMKVLLVINSLSIGRLVFVVLVAHVAERTDKLLSENEYLIAVTIYFLVRAAHKLKNGFIFNALR